MDREMLFALFEPPLSSGTALLALAFGVLVVFGMFRSFMTRRWARTFQALAALCTVSSYVAYAVPFLEH